MTEKGQILPVVAIMTVVMLVLAGLILDGGYLWLSMRWAQEDLDAAVCGLAVGANVTTPAEIVYGDRDVRGTLTATTQTFLLQLVGFREFEYTVRSRCLRPRAKLTPIAVKEPWLDGAEHPILGNDPPGEQQCDDCQGADFSGAVLPWVTCANSNCDPKTFYSPATETGSPNPHKSVFRNAILGSVPVPLTPIDTRVPQVSGVSNKFLVDAFWDAGYNVGDEIVVLVFDGSIAQPESGFGNWENLRVLYWAIMRITEMTTNSLSAELVEKIDNPVDVRRATHATQVAWNWKGALP